MVVNNRFTIQWLYVIGPNLPQNSQVGVQTTLPLAAHVIADVTGCNLSIVNVAVGLPAAGPNFRFLCTTRNVEAGAYWGFAIFIGY